MQVTNAAGEAINAGHHEHVALAEEFEDRAQLLPPRRARAAALLNATQRFSARLVKDRISAFVQALADLGWTVGRNVRIELRWTGGDTNGIRGLARELVGLQPDILLAASTPATAALQQETRTIPIVFASLSDPVASGLVARFDRPSGNVTGFADLESSLGGKWLELLSEITPALKRVAIMFNADTTPASRVYMPSVETAARALKIAAITESVHSDVEIETAIIALGRGLVVIPDFDQVPSGGQSQDCEGARPEVPSSILLRADEVIE